MPTNWDDIANQAGQSTDEHFKNKISSLTNLKGDDIQKLINQTGISKKNLTIVLREVKDATKSNIAKANAIRGISKGVDVLVELAEKLL